MICPKCGNNEWQMLIHVAEGVAFCSKCGNFGPIELNEVAYPVFAEGWEFNGT